MIIVGTVTVEQRVSLPESMIEEMVPAINEAVTGRRHANRLDASGRMIPINPPDVDETLAEAHRNIRRSHTVRITFDVSEKGLLINPRIKP